MFSADDQFFQLDRVHSGQFDIVLPGQIEDSGDPDTAVQMHVQIGLGQLVNELTGQFDLHFLSSF